MVTVTGNVAEFSFFRPGALRVWLAGDFNGWRPEELAMTEHRDGYWRGTVRLPRGDYRFRYNADGRWFVDYAAFGVQVGSYGLDGVVRVWGVSGQPGPAA